MSTTAPQARRTPVQARAIRTRTAVLQAAAEVLKRAGFDGFTMHAVAAEARFSVGRLYQYFPDKYSLLKALIDGWYNRVNDVAVPLPEFIDALADVYFSEPAATALLEALHAVPELRAYDHKLMERAVSRMARTLSAGGKPNAQQTAEARARVYAIDAVIRAATTLRDRDAKLTIEALKHLLGAPHAQTQAAPNS